jgi:acetoin utilization deacetylase AcuC-like enzyme
LDEEEDLKNILFISIHLFDEETKSFYPGSGSNESKNLNKSSENSTKIDAHYPGGILNVPVSPYTTSAMWRKCKE